MPDEPRVFNVLFLCPDNAVRSIIAEAIMNREGRGRFRAFSAGSYPASEVNRYTVRLLESLNYATADLRSRPWEDFAGPDAPRLDFVFVLDGEAAAEIWPEWPGHPLTAHWLLPDPATATGSEADISLAFADTYRMLNNRIELFMSLPLTSLDRLALQQRLDSIGRSDSARG